MELNSCEGPGIFVTEDGTKIISVFLKNRSSGWTKSIQSDGSFFIEYVPDKRGNYFE